MAAITWRNVDAPNLGDPARTLGMAQQSFNNAFDILNKQLTAAQAVDSQNWDARKALNTDQYLSRLQSFKTPEEAAAAQADLQALRQGFQAQIDMPAVRNAESNLTENLQRRVTTNNAYVTSQEDFAERDAVADLSAKIALGGTKALNEGLAANPNLSARARAALAAAARKADFENEDQGFQRNADARAQQALDLQRQELAQRRAERQAANAARAAEQNRIRLADLDRVRAMRTDAITANLAKVEDVVKNSPFSGTKPQSVEGKKLIRDALIETGVSAASVADPSNFFQVMLENGRGSKPDNAASDAAAKMVKGVMKLFGGGNLAPGEAQRLGAQRSGYNSKLPAFNKSGDEFFVYERDGNGAVVYGEDKKPKGYSVPLTAEFIADTIKEAKGASFFDPTPEGVTRVLQKRLEDPTLRARFMEFNLADQARNELRQKLAQTNNDFANISEDVLLGGRAKK